MDSKIKKFYKFVFEPVPFDLEVDLPLDDAIATLRANVFGKVPGFNSPEGMMGLVSEDTVRITRIEKYVRHSFKSYYIGSFYCDEDMTVLSGDFRIDRIPRIVLSLLLVLVPLLSIPFLIDAFKEASIIWSNLLAFLFLNAGLYVCLTFVGYSCKHNRLFLEKAISEALNGTNGAGPRTAIELDGGRTTASG